MDPISNSNSIQPKQIKDLTAEEIKLLMEKMKTYKDLKKVSKLDSIGKPLSAQPETDIFKKAENFNKKIDIYSMPNKPKYLDSLDFKLIKKTDISKTNHYHDAVKSMNSAKTKGKAKGLKGAISEATTKAKATTQFVLTSLSNLCTSALARLKKVKIK